MATAKELFQENLRMLGPADSVQVGMSKRNPHTEMHNLYSGLIALAEQLDAIEKTVGASRRSRSTRQR